MASASAFAPGNVSCVFKIIPHEDPARMHSLGMGFTVSLGVTATVEPARESEVSFNGEIFEFDTVRSVIEQITDVPMKVELSSDLPLSGGFGLSGASALATAFAVNSALGLGLEEAALGLAAHVAEVKNLTGLGDVAGQFHAGCLAKLVPGDPLAAVVLPVPEQVVHYRYYGPIRTRDIIGDPEHARRINAAADAALADIGTLRERGESSFARYIAVAKRFAIDSDLLRDERVRESIGRAEAAGGAASMIMLGNAVFATVEFEGSSPLQLSSRRVSVLS